jgi:hypothetical protein
MDGLCASEIARSRRGASSAGVRIGAVFFLDDLIPSLFGRPVFR